MDKIRSEISIGLITTTSNWTCKARFGCLKQLWSLRRVGLNILHNGPSRTDPVCFLLLVSPLRSRGRWFPAEVQSKPCLAVAKARPCVATACTAQVVQFHASQQKFRIYESTVRVVQQPFAALQVNDVSKLTKWPILMWDGIWQCPAVHPKSLCWGSFR